MLKGAMHMHSTYSDGEFALPELREIFLAEGCSFACVTDHAEFFDDASIRRYVEQCQSLSDDKFVFVAGLEYRCERNMHILGYGATQLNPATDPQEVIRHINSQNAISVIAHPKDDAFAWIESFESLPLGIEVWNTKYDGRYAPRPGTFALLQRLRQGHPEMFAFYGQDLHWKKQYRGMFVELDNALPKREAILRALATGNYFGVKDEYRLPSSGIIADELLAEFRRDHARSNRLWRIMKGGKQMLDRAGIRVPASIKAQLRRIF
ncbi:MAG: hypothetical protein WB919_18155 [Candidatus Sulfotelmatobacter sp.]